MNLSLHNIELAMHKCNLGFQMWLLFEGIALPAGHATVMACRGPNNSCTWDHPARHFS